MTGETAKFFLSVSKSVKTPKSDTDPWREKSEIPLKSNLNYSNYSNSDLK